MLHKKLKSNHWLNDTINSDMNNSNLTIKNPNPAFENFKWSIYPKQAFNRQENDRKTLYISLNFGRDTWITEKT